MSQQNKGTNSSSPAEPPVKRKRGRPRKDVTPVQRENNPAMPAAGSARKIHRSEVNQRSEVDQSNDVDDAMVGQVVSGVLEGSFDAGYFLSVKIGNTDTLLRGVVFLPGKFTPITAANDVAPQAKLYKRKEIPIPVLNPQTQLQSSMPQSEKHNKQSVKLEKQAAEVPDQNLPSQLQPGIQHALENQSASVTIPLTDNMTKNDAGQVAPQQTLEIGPEIQSASLVAQLNHNNIVTQDEMLQEFEESTLMEEPNSVVEASKDALPGNETVTQVPQVQDQALNSHTEPKELIHPEMSIPNPEPPQTVEAESKSVPPEVIGKLVDTPMETLASPENDIAQDGESEPAMKFLSGDDSSHSNERPIRDDLNVTEVGSQAALKTPQEESILFEVQLAAEGSDPQASSF